MARFSDLFLDVTKDGHKIPKENYLSKGKYPIIDQGQEYIAGYSDEAEGLYEDVPAIIFGDHTRIIKYVDRPCFLGADGVKLLKAKDTASNYKYLYYALCHARIPNTGYNRHFKWLKEVDIRLPNKYEQWYIVEVLDKLTGLISLRKQQLAKLDELVKARFVEMFGDPEYNNRNLPIYKLSDLCEVGSSKRIYQNEQSSDGVPFLRVSDLVNRIDKGIESCELFIPSEKYKELCSQKLVPYQGDILVTSRGTLGKCYIVKDTDKFYFQDGMISWLSNFDKRITSVYISSLFSMSGFQKQITSLQSGSTIAYLSISMLKKLNIILPTLQSQQQFVDFVEQVNLFGLTIQQSLDKLEVLRKSLMQEYFG